MGNNSAHLLTTVVVDDETPAREMLKGLLKPHAFVSVAGEAASAEEALTLIIRHQPDVVFLDVEMPGKNGFDLVEELRRLGLFPQLVFVTAFGHYAIQAIRCAALDYLMKPVDPAELNRVLNRLISNKMNHSIPKMFDHLLSQLEKDKRIRFNTRHGFVLINPGDILYIEADWNYAELFLKNKKSHMLSMNIGSVEKLLPRGRFTRISRSLIINLDCLLKVDRKKSSCFVDFGEGAKEIVIPRSRLRMIENDILP